MTSPGGPGQAAHAERLLALRLDDLLPQMQCGQCGHAGCRPYAQALAAGTAQVDQCKPGGRHTMLALAGELGCELVAQERAWPARPVAVAKIAEEDCVGCYKCIEACPVDAVIGAHGLSHTVFHHACTGCGLCVDPCPVDCISIETVAGQKGDGQLVQHGIANNPPAWAAARRLRMRHEAKAQRPPLRGAHGQGSVAPADMASQAMNRARRRKARQAPGG